MVDLLLRNSLLRYGEVMMRGKEKVREVDLPKLHGAVNINARQAVVPRYLHDDCVPAVVVWWTMRTRRGYNMLACFRGNVDLAAKLALNDFSLRGLILRKLWRNAMFLKLPNLNEAVVIKASGQEVVLKSQEVDYIDLTHIDNIYVAVSTRAEDSWCSYIFIDEQFVEDVIPRRI